MLPNSKNFIVIIAIRLQPTIRELFSLEEPNSVGVHGYKPFFAVLLQLSTGSALDVFQRLCPTSCKFICFAVLSNQKGPRTVSSVFCQFQAEQFSKIAEIFPVLNAASSACAAKLHERKATHATISFFDISQPLLYSPTKLRPKKTLFGRPPCSRNFQTSDFE